MSDLTIDRPIKGDISRYTQSRQEQGGKEEFLAQLDALLDTEGVEAVAWTQYTPYFNDGDPCEFSTGEIGLKLAFGDEELEDGEFYAKPGFYTTYELTETEYARDERGRITNYTPISKKYEVNGHDTEAIYDALTKFNLGRFENVVQDNFGDPATVTATKEGFEVEYYDHE